jgi:hypothetical protein
VLVVVLAAILLLAEAAYPFRPELPVVARHGPEHAATGIVSFDGSSILESRGSAGWVAVARRSGILAVSLELQTASPDQEGPARVLTIARDYLRSDLTVGQDGSDLVVRLRRPGSTALGEPALRVAGLLRDREWHRVTVVVDRGRAAVVADGRRAQSEPVGARPLLSWDPRYRVALGDEPLGDRGWAGDLRRATVSTPGRTVDLLATGVLRPRSDLVVRERARGLLHLEPGDSWPVGLLRLLAFVPLGAAIQWRWSRARWTLLAVALIAIATVLVKAFVAGRHPIAGDALLAACGGAIGCALGAWLAWVRPLGRARGLAR